MWTDIAKDLVSEEAIKEVGYDFEETDEFYYVMECLRYVSIYLPPYIFSISLLNLAYLYRRMFSALSNLAKISDGIAVNAFVGFKQSGKYDSEGLLSSRTSKKTYLLASF